MVGILFYFISALTGYIKNDLHHQAIKLFRQVNDPSEVMFTLLFNACAQLGTKDALNIVKQVSTSMPVSFRSDHRLTTSLLDAFIKTGDLPSAEKVFAEMNRSAASYGNMMSGYNRSKQPIKTLQLLDQMATDSIEPNHVNYLTVIAALSQLGTASMARRILPTIPQSILREVDVQNSLIDMWVRPPGLSSSIPSFSHLNCRANVAVSTKPNTSSTTSLIQIALHTPPWVCPYSSPVRRLAHILFHQSTPMV